MEAETVLAAAPLVGAGQTTVGTAVQVDHVRATPVGGSVDVSARVSGPQDGRRLTFEVTATDESGERVGGGEIERMVVDRARFLASLPAESEHGRAADEAERSQRPLRLASAVMFVHELDRSVAFYRELLGLDVTLRDDGVALLVSPDGYQLYLRSMGPRDPHPLGHIGIQYVIWTAEDEDDLRRCERVLRVHSTRVSVQTVDGFTIVEGRGPDDVPVLITFPGPDQAPRHEILQRIYQW
jgi:predicted thioesterase/catechol 2,3-dioxygenase-like lactoylglutathione lyase family enzyme